MTTQLRLFDGHAVESFRARMAAWEVEEEDVEAYGADEVIVAIFVATIDGAGHKRTKDGGWERTNTLTPSVVRVVKGDMRQELIEVFNLIEADQLSFVPPTSTAPAAAAPAAAAAAAPATPAPTAPPAASASTNGQTASASSATADQDDEADDDLPANPEFDVDDDDYAGPAPEVDRTTGEILTGAPRRDPALAAFLSEGQAS